MFRPIRDAVVKALDLDDEPEVAKRLEQPDRLAPEVLLRVLYRVEVDATGELTRILTRGSPNAVHALAAHVLNNGGVVWTPNVDELIERAAGWKIGDERIVALPDENAVPSDAQRLVKFHGTVSLGNLAFRSDQVMRRLAAPWAELMRRQLHDRDVLVYGYAGADSDVRRALDEALSRARSVTWVVWDAGEEDRIRRWYRKSAPHIRFRQARPPRDRAVWTLLIEWAHEHDLYAAVPPDLWDPAPSPRDDLDLTLPGSVTFASAALADELGLHSLARARALGALRTDAPKRRVSIFLLRIASLHHRPTNRVARAVLPAAAVLPASPVVRERLSDWRRILESEAGNWRTAWVLARDNLDTYGPNLRRLLGA